jgi:hypothetical protein
VATAFPDTTLCCRLPWTAGNTGLTTALVTQIGEKGAITKRTALRETEWGIGEDGAGLKTVVKGIDIARITFNKAALGNTG